MDTQNCKYGFILLLLFVCNALPLRCDDKQMAPVSPRSVPLNILFTGRLLGYFRKPILQGDVPRLDSGAPDLKQIPCPAVERESTDEGKRLLTAISPFAYKSRLFVGTGDNFALYLPSRIFAPPPDSTTTSPSGQYSKDQFRWSPSMQQWVDDPSELLRALREGLAVVPTDNVGCFMAFAGYDAIVPGKEDFYFGPERLQALARLLASIPESEHYHPVQTLAANLLVKTSWFSDHDPIPDSKKPTLPFYVSDLSKKPNIAFPADGTEVLPWLAEIEGNFGTLSTGPVEVVISGPTDDPDRQDWTATPSGPDLHIDFREAETRCWAVRDIPNFKVDEKCRLLEPTPRDDPNKNDPNKTGWQVSPLTPFPPGNYKACIWISRNALPTCSRFRVGFPFFQYNAGALPSPILGAAAEVKLRQKNPFPYLVKPVCDYHADPECKNPTDVAVFGVVDPDFEQKVGSLDAVWRTVDSNGNYARKYETSVEIIDPAKSLVQLLDYLKNCGSRGTAEDDCYGAAPTQLRTRRTFQKILLAQMDSTKATLLATHLVGRYHFDAVISEYDQQRFTRNQITVMDPTLTPMYGPSKNRDLQDCADTHCNVPSFVAVPPPSWDPTWNDDPVRRLRISHLGRGQRQYVVTGATTKSDSDPICDECVPEAERVALADSPRLIAPDVMLSPIAEKTLRDWMAALLPQPPPPTDKTETVLEKATLYAMLKATNADLAMMQKHDFYLPIDVVDCLLNRLSPGFPSPGSCRPELDDPSFRGVFAWQKVLDAVIWKGDLLTVIPVRGSVLQAVMKRSHQFDSTDASGLSLIKESDRGLVTLGIKADGFKDTYLINDLPLDPNRVYAVATTDYIALGDTGYPELVDSAVPSLPRPLYMKRRLQGVSGVVCNQLKQVPSASTVVCTPDFAAQGYFDELGLVGPGPLPGNTWRERWKYWVRSLKSHGNQESDLETWAQELPVWRFSLDKTNVGFAVQRHSDTQADLNNTFGGVSNAQATAPRSHSWNIDQQMSYTYNHHLWDFVSTEALLYNASFTDAKSGTFRNPNQASDSLTLSAGPRFHLPGMRRLPHWAIGTYFHYDTQPFSLEQSLSLTQSEIDVAKPLQFLLPRINTLTDRIGIGRYNQKSYFEVGVEGGRAFGAFEQFNIFTDGVEVLQCIPSATLSLQKCVSKFGDTIVTPTSSVQTVQNSRGRTGIYWHSMLSFPTGQRMSASLEDQGEFYFNNAGDNSTDTRAQNLLTAKYSFQIWPSLAFSPTYQIFAYQNKQAFNSLCQQQALITIDYKFDWTSTRIAASQLRYRAAQPK
jgi:hypothetical protein